MVEKEKKIYCIFRKREKCNSHLCSETKKSIVAERKALDSNCRDNNDEFKVQRSHLPHHSQGSGNHIHHITVKVQGITVTTSQSRFKVQGSRFTVTVTVNMIRAL